MLQARLSRNSRCVISFVKFLGFVNSQLRKTAVLLCFDTVGALELHSFANSEVTRISFIMAELPFFLKRMFYSSRFSTSLPFLLLLVFLTKELIILSQPASGEIVIDKENKDPLAWLS